MKIIKRISAAISQSLTPVSHRELVLCGFTKQGYKYTLTDLIIRNIGNFYYYKSPSGKLQRVKSMFMVARLVYGKLEYAR